jgi:hypothetical protein
MDSLTHPLIRWSIRLCVTFILGLAITLCSAYREEHKPPSAMCTASPNLEFCADQ